MIGGWDYFDHGHSVTLFLKIANPKPIKELMMAVKSAARSPYISLAKKIPYTTFEQLIPYLQNLDSMGGGSALKLQY